ncbi:cyclic nucleotide-binding domain-containing protein [Thiomicrorhabdus heinhorstiae]|uniref:Cyclic nucleotide-binding domain-containing protein n=1 Tax=Thiomicrorhabdus heinhorstiae TaxID=2748010 RepID=A0ABS0BZ04_9GAMM|nr:cyclic nucleotide-binding domain-containing protein [Thiomicrorhabdus heinhorstiae]MBF6058071.1 cyclic nucleotide-binding domain-containing protein [Thiomicrorhabdus heinhorstiae]
MLIESIVIAALLMGLLSALSLPLGALTTLIWMPSERTVAWLMAFGAGALLSAVTIDLFAPAIQNSEFFPVAIGSIIGSLFYLLLNKQLNQKGGFLRKTATLLQYLRHQQKLQNKQLILSVNRLKLFDSLTAEDRQLLYSMFEVRSYKANSIIFHQGDLLNEFYIVQQGSVNLRKASLGLKVVEELEENDAFGYLGFLSSMSSVFTAQTDEEVTLWVLSREKFNRMLQESATFYDVLREYFEQTSEVENYLVQEQGLTPEQSARQQAYVSGILQQERRLPFNRESRDQYDQAFSRLNHARRFAFMQKNSKAINTVIAGNLKLRRLKAGETLFARGSDADRLYLLESGSIELINPKNHATFYEKLSPGDYFGGMAFVVGGRHSSTAIATTDVSFWILERKDYEAILRQIPAMYEKLQIYLKDHQVHDYLTRDQRLTPTKAELWVKSSIKHLMPDKLPSLSSVNKKLYEHQAAYMAIWLGIFLDGIPESLMIGTHVTDGHFLSISLIAALFISNYPEALSSSASMKEQGFSFRQIFGAWFSLMLLTGLGAAIGSVALSDVGSSGFALISGIAAGAMLTVIAETMLPEAYARGGSIVGFVTLVGFLSALMFKMFD